MKINKICFGLFLYLGYTVSLYAENNTDNNVYFDPNFLELPNKDAVNLSQFENNEQLAGSYYVDIYVNTNLIGTKKFNFDKNRDNQLIPCLSLADLTDFGVKRLNTLNYKVQTLTV